MPHYPATLFIDTETLGLQENSPIWECAWARLSPTGLITTLDSVFVLHDPDLMDPDLPDAFRADYVKRYNPEIAVAPAELINRLQIVTADRPTVCGSKPSFDMDLLERMARNCGLQQPYWHHHPLDVPTLVHGYLIGRGVSPAVPWKSDFLSQAVGVDPRDYDRHTALGDVRWTMAMWRKVHGL